MPVFCTGLLTSEENLPLHGRLIAVPRDLDPHQGAYELPEQDRGAAVVFVVYHQGEPLDLTAYDVQLLTDGPAGASYPLENAPEAEPAADASRGEVRWAVPPAVTAQPAIFRAQVVVDAGGEGCRTSNVLRFRVTPRVGEEE